jgi:hypothetical protein
MLGSVNGHGHRQQSVFERKIKPTWKNPAPRPDHHDKVKVFFRLFSDASSFTVTLGDQSLIQFSKSSGDTRGKAIASRNTSSYSVPWVYGLRQARREGRALIVAWIQPPAAGGQARTSARSSDYPLGCQLCDSSDHCCYSLLPFLVLLAIPTTLAGLRYTLSNVLQLGLSGF